MIRELLKPRRYDVLVLAALTICAFVLYSLTLVPSVLDGDQGEYQLMLAALGIPHPTGFPLYVLLGKLWTILPFGSLAVRANLFSALWGALTVGALFLLLRRMKLALVAAIGGALVLALLSQFWEYATVAAVYRLHTFIAVLFILWLNEWEQTGVQRWLYLALLTAGIGLSNHLLIVFYGPAAILFVVLVGGRRLLSRPGFYMWGGAMVILPLLLYAYIPLRGHQLISMPEAAPGAPGAVAQGIVSPFYQEGINGLLSYLTGSAFISVALRHVSWSPRALLVDWPGNILNATNLPIALVSLVGLVGVFKRRAKLGAFLVVSYLTVQFLMLQYGFTDLAAIGQFSPYFREYFLSSFIAVVVVSAWGLDVILRAPGRLHASNLQTAFSFFTLALVFAILVFSADDLFARRPTAFTARSGEIASQWDTIDRFPPEQGAALVSHWGDLTPFWYRQFAEGWRRDLVGLFPPTDEQMSSWLAAGRPLYLAGPPLGWASKTIGASSLTPWGPLVRVTPGPIQPPSPLSQSVAWKFEDDQASMRVLGFDISRTQARIGDNVDIALYWEMEKDVPLNDYVVSLALIAPNQEPRTTNQPFFVSWLPVEKMFKGQRGLGTYRYAIPWDIQPGTFDLQLQVYSLTGTKTLNSVKLASLRLDKPLEYPDRIDVENPALENFGNTLEFLGWNGDVKEVEIGDSESIDTYWKVTGAVPNKTSIGLNLVDAKGSRLLSETRLEGKAGAIVRSVNNFTIPTDLSEGEYDLVLQVTTGSRMPIIQHRFFATGDSLTLAHVKVTNRSHSYSTPPIRYAGQAGIYRMPLRGAALAQTHATRGIAHETGN